MNPSAMIEHISIQCGNNHCLITPVTYTPPYTKTGFMPWARHYCVFTFRTIYCKELSGKMGVVYLSYRHDDVPCADIEARAKRFLNPELLQSHFTPTFYFFFKFSGFFVFYFYSRFCSSVFKLYFTTHAPSFSEIVANHDYYMR